MGGALPAMQCSAMERYVMLVQITKCENAPYGSFSFSQHCVGAKIAFPTLRGFCRAPPKASHEMAPVCLAVLCRMKIHPFSRLQGLRHLRDQGNAPSTKSAHEILGFGWSFGVKEAGQSPGSGPRSAHAGVR